MLRTARSVGTVLATLTPLAAIATGELALQHDDSNKAVYAKQKLLAWRSNAPSAAESESESNDTGASAWLGSAPPKFPYLLSISAGDNPRVVANALLGGVKVLGSYEEPTRDMLERLTEPTSTVPLVIHGIAKRYADLKASLHRDVPVDFDPSAGLKANTEDKMMQAVLAALREIRPDGKALSEVTHVETQTNTLENTPDHESGSADAIPVFFLRDFDELSDIDAERWLRWTFQMTNEGLAHVVVLTTSTVTPSKMEWLQTRHQQGVNAAGAGGNQDFVAILLRPANTMVDSSSAHEKLVEISHKLQIFPSAKESISQNDDEAPAKPPSTTDDTDEKNFKAELDLIAKTVGNWWSDIDAICQRLVERKLHEVTHHDDRMAIIHEVCDIFVKDTEIELLKVLSLDGSLKLQDTSNPTLSNSPSVPTSECEALSALEAWKCLETLAEVTPATGGASLMGSPKQLLQQQKNEKPLNCVSPVEALLPFNYREDGENKFLSMVDRQILFFRPKDAVEIAVIPCNKAALLSSCWVQIRPVMKKAFEKIHRNDAYFRVILDLERFAANTEMRKEVDLYEQEIAERRQFLLKSKSEFAILQFTMTPAEKAQRKAELALIEVELQAKDVYLEKLRSLLS